MCVCVCACVYVCLHIVCVCVYFWFDLVWFYVISSIVGYLMPNPVYIYIYISNIYDW